MWAKTYLRKAVNRFHTASGVRLPASAWTTIPRAAWVTVSRRPRTEPWMTRPAIRFMDTIIERTWGVLELGAGYSTIWLAQRCRSLVSLESDPHWRDRVETLLDAERLACDLRMCPVAEFPEQVSHISDGSVDLVIVDFAEGEGATRLACVVRAAPKVRPGGYIVLDNSDRPQYAPADELLRDWTRQRFTGMVALPLQATETTFYRKPDNSIGPSGCGSRR